MYLLGPCRVTSVSPSPLVAKQERFRKSPPFFLTMFHRHVPSFVHYPVAYGLRTGRRSGFGVDTKHRAQEHLTGCVAERGGQTTQRFVVEVGAPPSHLEDSLLWDGTSNFQIANVREESMGSGRRSGVGVESTLQTIWSTLEPCPESELSVCIPSGANTS